MRIKDINKVDIFVVITILSVIFLSYSFYFAPKSANRPFYQIMINDADGLIVGSSVVFGGKDVGHVTRLKFEDNQVKVDFVIENTDFPKIPDGSEITVKSTGLAGSKALEIYLPPNNKNKGIIIKDAIRQKASDDVKVTIAKNIINSAHSVSSAFSTSQIIEFRNFALHQRVISNCTNVIETIILRLDGLQHDINKKKLKNVNKKLENKKNADD